MVICLRFFWHNQRALQQITFLICRKREQKSMVPRLGKCVQHAFIIDGIIAVIGMKLGWCFQTIQINF